MAAEVLEEPKELGHTHATPGPGPKYPSNSPYVNPAMNIALPPAPVGYVEPTFTWQPYIMNIVTPGSYTLCGSLVA